MYIIPLTPSPNQTFTSTIPIDNKKIALYFFLRYNTEAKYWVMDVSDLKRNTLINSIPLICGNNLLEQYGYMNIGSAYIVKTDKTLLVDRPNEYNLGTSFILVWGDSV